MEAHLSAHGVIILKFWLEIDRDEQLRRFKSRQTDPFKQYKITDEDWRNRENWDSYEEAIDEMLTKTNMPHAPWFVIESNKKKFARLKVLETVVKTLEAEL
jgi:polyphosphate kinase 2 (PPK2 family)